MKVHFFTNLDWYRSITWPTIIFVPRKGELVQVAEKSLPFCKANKIPATLEVVNVTYVEKAVLVELWYRKTDTDAAKISGKLSHLYQQ